MIDKKEIEKLGELSRVAIDKKDIGPLQKDLSGILDFVSKLKSAPKLDKCFEPDIYNVTREDENPRKDGEYTEKSLIKVKKVFD